MEKNQNEITKIENEIYNIEFFLNQIQQEQNRIQNEIQNLFKNLNEKDFDININKKILKDLNPKHQKDKKYQKNPNDEGTQDDIINNIQNDIYIKKIYIEQTQEEINKREKILEKLSKDEDKTREVLNNILNKYRTLTTKQYLCEKKEKLNLKDIILIPENKKEINELIDQYKDPEKYEKYWISKPKWIIFHWQKKVGKSLIVRSLWKELWYPVYTINSQNIINRSNQNDKLELNNILEWIQNNSIVFFDEIDEIIEIFGWRKIVIDTISNYIKKNKSPDSNIIFIISTSWLSKLDKEITKIFFDYKLFDKQINFKPLWKTEIWLLLDNINKQYNLNFNNETIANKLILAWIQEPWIIKNIIEECFKNSIHDWKNKIDTQYISHKIDSYKMQIKTNTWRAWFI